MTLYIGLMSGTSADGMDAALVDINNSTQPSVRLIDALCLPYQPDFRQRLRQAALAVELAVEEIIDLEQTIADLSAQAVQTLLQRNELTAIDIRAIGCHGHTLRHKAQPNGFSWQVGDSARIAELTGICCVADFRRRDIAAGGQGAPLVPAFHQHALNSEHARMVLNIGGIANLTVLPHGKLGLAGFDVGPGNALLDEWCQRQLNCACDQGGQLAAQGKIITHLLEQWLQWPYFRQPPPKSTGREVFNLEALGDLSQHSPVDIAATLTELTARSISDSIQRYGHQQGELLICGGGVHNHFLLQRLRSLLPQYTINSSNSAGLDPDWLEAIAFAWLASRTLQGLSGNAPAVTGAAGERILGAIYPA